MNFSQSAPDPRQNLVGISAVVLFHVIIVYALVSGLAKKVVDVVRAPIETKVIEEVKETPPPQELVPPPRLEAPPPPYIPPPDITVTAPPPAPTIVATTPTPPPAPVPFTPAPAPAVEAPVAPPAPAAVQLGVACPKRVEPQRTARQEGVAGAVRARITIRGGKVANVEILSSQPKGLFDAVVRSALMQYSCNDVGHDQVAVQNFQFTAD
ncbi:MAG TPA: energy transducer TonB [Candidatus Aquabacterium excrementipullorum]|nr:energy transducer TonB [Candidatus Aquabacterium excrementipullorum]